MNTLFLLIKKCYNYKGNTIFLEIFWTTSGFLDFYKGFCTRDTDNISKLFHPYSTYHIFTFLVRIFIFFLYCTLLLGNSLYTIEHQTLELYHKLLQALEISLQTFSTISQHHQNFTIQTSFVLKTSPLSTSSLSNSTSSLPPWLIPTTITSFYQDFTQSFSFTP